MPPVRPSFSLSVLVVLISLAGCSGGGGDSSASHESTDAASDFDRLATPPASGAGNTADSANGRSANGRAGNGTAQRGNLDRPQEAARPLEQRTSLEGRWDLALHGFGSDLIGMLIDVTAVDGGYQFEAVGESPLGWELTESEVVDDAVRLQIVDAAERVLDFQGTFRDGAVRGSVAFGGEGLDLASLQPSSRGRLGPQMVQEETPGFEKIAGLRPDDNLLRNLATIARESEDPALAYQIYNRMFAIVRSQPDAELDLPALIDGYIASAELFGERVTTRAHLDVGYALAVRGELPEQALQHLELAATGLRGEDDAQSLRDRIDLSRSLVLVSSAAEDERNEGIALLEAALEEQPLNLLAISRLAEVYEQQSQPEQALEMHARLVALPAVPGDQGRLAELWAELGRDPQELDAYLDEVYEELVYHFAEGGQPAAAVREKQQVVLGELFTGAMCGPCVAADVATGALETIYPQSQFVMLRYHQHIPGPDPLTVADGEERGQYYELRGTPTVCLNGNNIQGVGGGFFNAEPIFRSLTQIVSDMLEQTTDLVIDLSANADEAGERIQVRATVTGADEFPESWRLRLCLAEDTIRYPAPNGIRIHEMVVRTMPGGAEGIPADQGALTFEADIPLDEILAEINAGIEAANSTSRRSIPPLTAQISELRLVAFVQDDDTLDILQAASTPVNGLPQRVAQSGNAVPAID